MFFSCQVTIVKAEDKLYLYVDFVNVTQTKIPKLKTISKLFIGGSPSGGHDCFENLVSCESWKNPLVFCPGHFQKILTVTLFI